MFHHITEPGDEVLTHAVLLSLILTVTLTHGRHFSYSVPNMAAAFVKMTPEVWNDVLVKGSICWFLSQAATGK